MFWYYLNGIALFAAPFKLHWTILRALAEAALGGAFALNYIKTHK